MMESLIINTTDLQATYDAYLTMYDVGSSEPQTSYIEVPGRNGKIDITDFLGVTYSNRTITADLAVKDLYRYNGLRKALETLNGTIVKISETGDPSIYWKGRMAIGSYSSEHGKISTIEITVDADPFPYNSETDEEVR